MACHAKHLPTLATRVRRENPRHGHVLHLYCSSAFLALHALNRSMGLCELRSRKACLHIRVGGETTGPSCFILFSPAANCASWKSAVRPPLRENDRGSKASAEAALAETNPQSSMREQVARLAGGRWQAGLKAVSRHRITGAEWSPLPHWWKESEPEQS